jgi:hypothetical protein
MNYNGMDDDEADDDNYGDGSYDDDDEDTYDDGDGYGDETSSDSGGYLYGDDDDMLSYVRRLQAIQPEWDRDAVRSVSDRNFTSRSGATNISFSQRVLCILLTSWFMFSRYFLVLFSTHRHLIFRNDTFRSTRV